LQKIREKAAACPTLDIAAELRGCDCSDFLTRFKTQIIVWESEQLGERVIPELLDNAAWLFSQGHYVSCVNVLNGVETSDATITDRVVGFELLRGLAFFAVEMKEQSLAHLDREVQKHDNPAARQFIRDAFESPAQIDVQQWCRENAEQYNFGLVIAGTGDVQEAPSCPVTTQK